MQENGHVVVPSQTVNHYPQSTTNPSFKTICAELNDLITTFLDRPQQTPLLQKVQQQTRTSVNVCEDALERYGLDQLSLSYNGGKDCLVLLITYLVALHRHFSHGKAGSTPFPDELDSVYIRVPHPFTEVTTFVEASAAHYRLKLDRLDEPMKEAFQKYLDLHKTVKAIFVGTRRTDPHGANLKFFDATDGGWPAFMRIHPVIDWHYSEIWAFLKVFDVPYCSLYDKGYTSLGGTNNTKPNPALRIEGSTQFRPAFELVEDDEERLGRGS